MSPSHPKSEIYVINLLKASDEARELVASYLGRWVTSERESLLTRLPKQDQLQILADKLRCPENEVFEILADQIHETARRQPLPPFSFDHLHRLASDQYQHRLAPILECDSQKVLDNLFNVIAILEVLFEFHPDWVRQQYGSIVTNDHGASTVAFILLKLLDTKERIETRFKIDDFGWEDFIDARQIISSYALGKLQNRAIKQGYAVEFSSRLLALALNTASATEGFRREYDAFLDALGVLEIKRRIDWIVRQLRESAQYETNGNAITRDIIVDSDRIQMYLDFYELREPAVVWRKILKSEANLSSVGDRLTALNVQTTGQSGTPKADARLQVRVEEVLSSPSPLQFWKKSRVIDNRLIVSCDIKEQPAPVDILICSQVPTAQVSELTALFTSLQGGEVATDFVLDLSEQILEKQLIFPEDLKEGIEDASNQFLVEFIRGLILTGVTIPYDIDPIWINRFNSSPPITAINYEPENNLPVNRKKILERIQQQYSMCNNVKIVS